MLKYKKLLTLAVTAIITGNRMNFMESIAWKIHCYFHIYRSVFGNKTWKQNLGFVLVGLLLYSLYLPDILRVTAALDSDPGFISWYIKWFAILLQPILWFVALPNIIFLMNRGRK